MDPMVLWEYTSHAKHAWDALDACCDATGSGGSAGSACDGWKMNFIFEMAYFQKVMFVSGSVIDMACLKWGISKFHCMVFF